MEYIVEVVTTAGPLLERYATYHEAQARVEQLPADTLLGIPFIFRELPDDSVRLVREDGKPLQWHRLEGRDRTRGEGDEAIPLGDDLPEAAGYVGPLIRPVERPRDDSDAADGDPPIRLAGDA